ncbi:hypothetical protein AB0M46_07485 [Dactylosporangium sp. NPDC051485]|uniref:hypothetical protein n=1 Tax=Dactylosporangium sp. NPDC051485 TaxID=3154846 RepID=UPI00342C1E80
MESSISGRMAGVIRAEVREFLRLGPLPSEEDGDDSDEAIEVIEAVERALHAIAKPVTQEEAEALIEAFGPDTCFGLAWTLLHLVESAPVPVVTAEPPDGSNDWVVLLWRRSGAW